MSGTLGESTEAMRMRKKSDGKANMTSVTRMRTLSARPPK